MEKINVKVTDLDRERYLNRLAVNYFNRFNKVKAIVHTSSVRRVTCMATDVGFVEFRPKKGKKNG